MLWRDLAGRLEGLVTWIDRHRSPGGCVGRLGVRIDPIIEELGRLREDAQDCGGDDPTDLRPLQGVVRRSMDGFEPTGGHPPAETKREGKESLPVE